MKKYKITYIIEAKNLDSFNSILGEKIKEFQKQKYQGEVQFSTAYIPQQDKFPGLTIYTGLLLMY